MRKLERIAVLTALALAAGVAWPADTTGSDRPLKVVTTLPDYSWLAAEIGGPRVRAESIARGDQDPHFVRPKPSFQVSLRDSDVFVTTGLDLELWVPALLDAAGNRRILEGAPGYVAAWQGIELRDIPKAVSRVEGDVHIFGNPHIHTDPLNMTIIGRNILAALKRVDPANAAEYDERARAFEERLHRRLFGEELVGLVGGETLARLERAGSLRTFLEQREYPRGSGQKLIERLGGWLKRAESLRGRQIIAYHKSWAYFSNRFGLEVVGYVEPKPGIPPTPRQVESLIELVQKRGIRVILAENYFDPVKPRVIAERTGAHVAVVPLSTGGEPGVESYEKLIDVWIDRLLAAYAPEAKEQP